MFTFLHAADIHLDSPLVGLERYGDAPVDELRGASRRAFKNLVDLAIEEHVAFVVLAGDIYDGDWKDYNTGLFFIAQVARLKAHDIPVYMLAGNHDAANQFSKSLHLPGNVSRFSTAQPETFLLDDHNVALHGRGFPARAVSDNLAASYPPAIAGRFNIGVLHTSLDGREGHASYAPCSLDGLRSKHYQYWALGHVHQQEEVSHDPWVVFPGNIQGRHVRETGPKGCSLVTVADGEVSGVDNRPLDVFRWNHCRIDLSGLTTEGAVLDRVGEALNAELAASDGRCLAVRVELSGRTATHTACMAHPEQWEQELRALAIDRCGESVWLEKVVIRTTPDPPPGASGSSGDTFEGPNGVLEFIGNGDGELLGYLSREFTELRGKLPAELVGPDVQDPLDPTSPSVLKEVAEQARQLLVARLSSQE